MKLSPSDVDTLLDFIDRTDYRPLPEPIFKLVERLEKARRKKEIKRTATSLVENAEIWDKYRLNSKDEKEKRKRDPKRAS